MSAFLSRVLGELRGEGKAPLFLHDGAEMTRREGYDRLLGLYGKLAAEGIGDGDLVAVDGGNRPDTMLAQLAVHLSGASLLLIPASASRPDRGAVLASARVSAVFAEQGHGGYHRTILLRPSTMDVTEPVLSATVHTVFSSGGTTGTPKLIGHRGIYEGMAHIFPTGGGDDPNRVLVVAPLSHLTGHCAALGALLTGDTVLLHEGFDAEAVLHAIGEHGATHLSLTPPRLAALLDHPKLATTELSGLRRVSLGASPLPVRRLSQALDVFGPIVGQGYGLTEAPMIASIDAADYADHPERLGSVGRVVPGMEARIDEGEVLVRGLALMEGYHEQPELTARAVGDGWLRTGDVGRFDHDGFLYLLDRADDVVVTGEHGTKVYSTVVEDAIAAHPLVRQAAVVGVRTGADDGDTLHAVVVADPALTAGLLREHVRALLGQEHFVPATVEFTGELPLTEVGKVDKSTLRARRFS
ncbi:fatty acid--CoA ligase [Prauserella marina]|uniref:Acyl-CoA synthetase (AMP-forming)/AMP-acid ligase II n=1 Tax=Prauserella marina TaxID=530584 RepID=A0A222VJY5_9PSEU|nr:AMP-binding protein [Prauserella marina]ASR34239.1 fatty acid--CoA ligase [Prauserella marina]PWV71996.1 acyl-CoA synthetase (AMP-forming)/AMP-acid ligase II [Prauserella marina]SDD92836.1 Acyl-CoA synthetase (AMP-forming)/AMP-acid ligase II [Prauserella marina]